MPVDDGEELSPEDATSFRAAVARMNYLAQDRVDVSFSAKELCRAMARPTTGALTRLKRAVRYLSGRERLVTNFYWQPEPKTMDVYIDTDFAGCRASRRSTSGGVCLWGSHAIKHGARPRPQ